MSRARIGIRLSSLCAFNVNHINEYFYDKKCLIYKNIFSTFVLYAIALFISFLVFVDIHFVVVVVVLFYYLIDQSSIYSFTHLLIYSFIYLFVCLFIRSVCVYFSSASPRCVSV